MRIAFVKDHVPQGMKLIHTVVVFELESIGSVITIWIITVESRLTMEWLMDITEVVDEKTESIGLLHIGLVRIQRSDLGINIRLEIFSSILAR